MDFQIGLAGKTALVCGASAGIGEATTRVLAGLGARVVAAARTEAALKNLVASLPGSGHRVFAVDLNDHARVRAGVGDLLKELGSIEILVNNSSGPKGGPVLDAKPEEFAAAFTQHLVTNQVLAQLLVPGMKAKGYGRIVNVISTSVRMPIPGLGVSNTVRGAVASWAKTLALEVAPFGITVNSVLPGYTKTQRLEQLLKATAERTGRSEADVASEWKRATPVGRFAEPAELAQAVAFLASPAAAFITGVALPVDGGRIGAI